MHGGGGQTQPENDLAHRLVRCQIDRAAEDVYGIKKRLPRHTLTDHQRAEMDSALNALLQLMADLASGNTATFGAAVAHLQDYAEKRVEDDRDDGSERDRDDFVEPAREF